MSEDKKLPPITGHMRIVLTPDKIVQRPDKPPPIEGSMKAGEKADGFKQK